MTARLLLIVALAAVVGSVAGLATSTSERGEAFRQFASTHLAPVARLINAYRDGELMSTPGQAVDSIRPYYAIFFSNGKVDPDMRGCAHRASPQNGAEFNEKMVGLAEHHTVATVIACLLDHDWRRFCNPGGREQIVAAEEIYFWSRHRASDHERRIKAERQYYDEGERKTYHDADGDHYDPYDLSWDGPEDREIVDDLKRFAREGYVALSDFGFFPRDEIRSALDGVTVEKNVCDKT